MGFLDKIKQLFGKEENPWGEQSDKQSLSNKIPRVGLPKLPTIGKVRVPGLRRSKRVLAGILLVLNSMTAVMAGGGWGSLIFLSTAFILLDYLVKTRSDRWV